MVELGRTNDMALLSFVEALLSDARLGYVILDTHMSVLDGSLGILPRRVMVDAADLEAARRLLADAGARLGS